MLLFDDDPQAEEEDNDARVIAHAKCNLARRQDTLTARVVSVNLDSPEGPIETSRMILGEVSNVRADELGKHDQEQRTATNEAGEFLSAFLADGAEHEFSEVKAAASVEDISERTLKRAAQKLKVVRRREGSGASHRSLWSLQNTGPSGPSGLSQRRSIGTQATQATQATEMAKAPAGRSDANGFDPRPVLVQPPRR